MENLQESLATAWSKAALEVFPALSLEIPRFLVSSCTGFDGSQRNRIKRSRPNS